MQPRERDTGASWFDWVMRASSWAVLVSVLMMSLSLSGCFGSGEDTLDVEPDEVDAWPYSVVAPIDTGINVYHVHFAMNESYPQWLLDGLGVTMWCNLTQEGSWAERYEADRPTS